MGWTGNTSELTSWADHHLEVGALLTCPQINQGKAIDMEYGNNIFGHIQCNTWKGKQLTKYGWKDYFFCWQYPDETWIWFVAIWRHSSVHWRASLFPGMYPILYLSPFRHSFALLQPSHVTSMSSEHIHLLAIVGSFKSGRVLFLVLQMWSFFPPPFSLSVSKCLREGRMGGWLESGCGRARACFWSWCGLILGPSFVCFCPFSDFFQSRVPASRIFLPFLDFFGCFINLKSYRSMS